MSVRERVPETVLDVVSDREPLGVAVELITSVSVCVAERVGESESDLDEVRLADFVTLSVSVSSLLGDTVLDLS